MFHAWAASQTKQLAGELLCLGLLANQRRWRSRPGKSPVISATLDHSRRSFGARAKPKTMGRDVPREPRRTKRRVTNGPQ